MTTLHQASLSAPFSQQHLLTLCLFILVILAIFQTFLLYLLGVGALWYYCYSCFWHCLAITTTTTKSLQSCPTLCNPTDGSPPGSAVPGILQARTLEWVAISFSNAWKWKVKSLSRVRLLATPWPAAYQAPLFMGFSRQKYWSGVLLPSLV